MERRKIGRSSLEIAPLVLGCNMFGWTVGDKAAFAILDRFIDAGFNAIDTADVYSTWVPGHSGGESEAIIGAWFKARRHRARIVLQTKVGAPMSDGSKGLSAKHIATSVEQSLRRLGTDYIDLYQSHLDDVGTPFEETLEAFDRLISAGKVRAVGTSHFSPDRLAEIIQVSETRSLPRYESLQPRYNLYDRSDYGTDLQRVCVDNAISVLCYSTLAKGFLTGAYRPGQGKAESTWSKVVEERYLNERGARVMAALEAVSREQDARLAEVALAWVSAQPGVAAPIVGVEHVEQLDESLGYPRLVLDRVQLDRLTAAGVQ